MGYLSSFTVQVCKNFPNKLVFIYFISHLVELNIRADLRFRIHSDILHKGFFLFSMLFLHKQTGSYQNRYDHQNTSTDVKRISVETCSQRALLLLKATVYIYINFSVTFGSPQFTTIRQLNPSFSYAILTMLSSALQHRKEYPQGEI